MRLIDAERLKGEIRKAFPSLYMRVEINTLVNLAPSIEIVHCRECKWFDKDNLGDTYCTWSKGLCDAKPDDFCSYGERKGADDEV